MKTRLLVALLFGAFTAAAWGDFSWPEKQTTVRINGVEIEAVWRDGKPFVSRDRSMPVLHIRTGPMDLDLAEVLAERGYIMTLNKDGSIDCARPQSAVADPEAWGRPLGSAGPVPSASPQRSTGRTYRGRSSRRTSVGQAYQGRSSGIVGLPNATANRPPGRRPAVNTSAQEALVDEIGQQLAGLSRRPISWTFKVVKDSDANAWTPGEGRVFITTALLDLQLTRDEIAGILGHEIAHGARQHVANEELQRGRERKAAEDRQKAQEHYAKAQQAYQRAMSGEHSPDSLQAMMARDALDWETHRVRGEMRQVERQNAANDSYREHETVFNHAQESEADAIGLGYSITAGYRPDGLLTALQKLGNSEYQSYGARSMMGSKTHPPLPERIARLQELLRRRGY